MNLMTIPLNVHPTKLVIDKIFYEFVWIIEISSALTSIRITNIKNIFWFFCLSTWEQGKKMHRIFDIFVESPYNRIWYFLLLKRKSFRFLAIWIRLYGYGGGGAGSDFGCSSSFKHISAWCKIIYACYILDNIATFFNIFIFLSLSLFIFVSQFWLCFRFCSEHCRMPLALSYTSTSLFIFLFSFLSTCFVFVVLICVPSTRRISVCVCASVFDGAI